MVKLSVFSTFLALRRRIKAIPQKAVDVIRIKGLINKISSALCISVTRQVVKCLE